jgi:hypothetical protein
MAVDGDEVLSGFGRCDSALAETAPPIKERIKRKADFGCFLNTCLIKDMQ